MGVRAEAARSSRIARQRGAAIVSVLVLVTLATMLVASLFWRQHLATRSVLNRQASAQLRWIETAVLDWASVVLRADQNSGGQVDHLQETWAVPVAETRLDETVTAGARISGSTRSALIAGQIFDAQGRLNLSNLVHEGKPVDRQVQAYRRLLAMLGLPPDLEPPLTDQLRIAYPAPAAQAGALAAAGSPTAAGDGSSGEITPGASAGTNPSAVGLAGAGSSQLAQAPPILKLRDLMRLPGYDERVIAALTPFAILLPKGIPLANGTTPTAATRVNVNTASAEVLSALAEELPLEAARRIVLLRERVVFAGLDQIGDRTDARASFSGDLFSVGSNFFTVAGVVRFERIEASSEALFFRGPTRVELVWRQHY